MIYLPHWGELLIPAGSSEWFLLVVAPLPLLAVMAINIAISLALSAISFLLRPKPPKQKPPEFEDIESPEAGEGRHMPRVFGTVTVRGTQVIGYRNKNTFRTTIRF